MLKKYGVARRPDASVVFTDREEPRETFRQFFERLYQRNVRGNSGSEAPLLHFYGVGGVGKTTLLRQASKEFTERFGNETDFVRIHVAHVDLHGLPLGAQLLAPDMLRLVRNALQHNNLSTPLFDCSYLLLWQKDNPGLQMDLPKSGLRFLNPVVDIIDSFAETNGALKWLRKIWEQGVDARQRKFVAERWGDIHPSEWTQQQLRERLGELLWMDIVRALEADPYLRVCMLIDEFERIQTIEPKLDDAQTALADLIGALVASESEAVRQRFCVAIMGREVLRWEVTHDPDWQSLVESHILGGLTEKDAKVFLIEKVAAWYREKGNNAAADVIVRDQEEILRVTNSANAGEEPSHLPFHLDLVLEVINAAPDKFTGELLANESGHKRALEDRFLRYLKGHDDQLLKALQSLALCHSFDRALFEDLLTKQVIVGYGPTEFMQIVGDDHSYVGPNPNLLGYFQFHRQMQLALINSQLTTEEVKNGTRERLEKILEYFVQQAQFSTPAEFSEHHQHSLQLGFEVLKGEAANVLLTPEVISNYAFRLIRPHDFKLATKLVTSFLLWLVDYCEARLGSEHLTTLTSINSLASCFRVLGDLKRAKALNEKVLAIMKRLSGPVHPDTLASMNNLALILCDLGDMQGAKVLQEHVLAGMEHSLGPDHPVTLRSKSNLALTIHALGDLQGARTLQEDLLAVQERLFGPDHQDTMTSMHNVALTHSGLGNSHEAKNLLEKVVALNEHRLGPEHPDTLTSMDSLGATLRDLGDALGAMALHERVLAVRKRLYGLDHPDTLTSMNNVAWVYSDLGDMQTAKVLHDQVLAGMENCLGQDHPVTLTSMNSLAITLRDQGDTQGAKTLFERVLAKRQRLLGTAHPDTLMSMNYLALTHSDLGNSYEAKNLLEQVVALMEHQLGPEHPDTVDSIDNLACILRDLGDTQGAKDLLEQALTIRKRQLGSDHPDTLSSTTNVAWICNDLGDMQEAKSLLEQVLTAQERLLGTEHPDTLMSMNTLAVTLRNLGDTQEVKTLVEQVLAVEKRILGPEHPDTLTSMDNLAVTLCDLGDMQKAKALFEQVLEIRERILGPRHSDTLTSINYLASTLRNLGDMQGATALEMRILNG